MYPKVICHIMASVDGRLLTDHWTLPFNGKPKNELLASIGKGYGKTAAQVALRWLTQRGIVAIPKSTHVERMRQNLDIFDFTLTDEEMKRIATLNRHDAGTVSFGDPQFVKFLIETYG